MSEIEKLYENCGIEIPIARLKIFKDDNGEIFTQPPFTAEEQLSLMAFLINRKVGLSFKAEQGEITVEAISRGLAGIVNRIWRDLTEEEKETIRGILRT